VDGEGTSRHELTLKACSSPLKSTPKGVDVFFKAAHATLSASHAALESVHVRIWVCGGLSVTVPEISSVLFDDNVSVVPEIAVTVVPSLIPLPSARIPTDTPVVLETTTVFCPAVPVADFAGLGAVKVRVPETALVFGDESTSEEPNTVFTVAPLATPDPVTDIPTPIPRESERTSVVDAAFPVAAFVVLGNRKKSIVPLTAPVWAEFNVTEVADAGKARMVVPTAIFGPETPMPTNRPVLFGTVSVVDPDDPVEDVLLTHANGVSSARML